MDALQAAYESARERMPGVSLDDFARVLEACEVHPVEVDGKPAGAIVVRGSEVHACVLPFACGRWFNKRAATVLNAVIDRHGFATTHATTAAGRRFVERLGFVLAGDHYRKEVRYGH